MEKTPLNATDRQIDAMVEGLRADSSEDAPAHFVDKMLSRPQPKPSRGVPALRLGFAGAAVAAAALVLWPRESPAAMLQRVLTAIKANSFRHEIAYEMQPDGQFEVRLDQYYQGSKSHIVDPRNQTEFFHENGRQTTFFKTKGYAYIEDDEKTDGQNFSIKDTLPSVEKLLNMTPNRRVSYARSVSWRGRTVDRYQVSGDFPDAQGKVLHFENTLYAEPGTDLPVYEVSQVEGFPPYAHEWQYPAPNAKAFDFSLPKGTTVYDLNEERRTLLATAKKGIGTTKVGDMEVTLRAVVVDREDGGILAITTGGEGRIERAPEAIRIEGMGQGQSSGTGMMQGAFWNDKFVYRSCEWQGMRLVGEYAGFGKGTQFPDRFRLSIPIWKEDLSLPRGYPHYGNIRYKGPGETGRKFVGYATFEVQNPIRTPQINLVVTPRNLSIFDPTERRQESATATAD